MGCELLVPWSGCMESEHWKLTVLTTGPPGKSLLGLFDNLENHNFLECFSKWCLRLECYESNSLSVVFFVRSLACCWGWHWHWWQQWHWREICLFLFTFLFPSLPSFSSFLAPFSCSNLTLYLTPLWLTRSLKIMTCYSTCQSIVENSVFQIWLDNVDSLGDIFKK